MFKTVSQVGVNYRGNQLCAGTAGRVHGGDRPPWVPSVETSNTSDNFATLTALDWQVHDYGEAMAALVDACRHRGLPLHAWTWRQEMPDAG